MLISVIMPVYNNLKYLKESVDSILKQTHSDLEFIIIDDASTESIWDFLQSYDDSRLVLGKNDENIGLTKSLNICLDMAKGDLIARQDISMPHRLEKEAELFKGEIGLVSCWGYSIDENGIRKYDKDLEKKIRAFDDETIKKRVIEGNEFSILGPSVMYSREAFEKIGYYDESLYFSQDRNYYIRLLKYFNVTVAREELMAYRRHGKSVRFVHNDKYGKLRGSERKEWILEHSHKNPILKDKGKRNEGINRLSVAQK
jgi:glycosyltransferase involved in cell wall biosynthesis